jgi:hypothetical protein
MNWREKAQQVNAKELGSRVFTMPPAGVAVGPAFVNKIVWDQRTHKFKQGSRANRRKIGIHANQTTGENLTRHRQWQIPQF